MTGRARDFVRVLDDAPRGCWVDLAEGFLDGAEAVEWMARLSEALPFAAEAPVMFGRPMPVRRRSCGIGEAGVVYRYAGVERAAHPWPAGFEAVLARVRAAAGERFNYALCNLYPDGAAAMGWHTDDEASLVPEAPIASLSLGAPRDFALRLGRAGPALCTVTLAPGSLLVMGGATQRHYQHRLPPRARCTAPRINLTFRRMRG